MTDAVYESILRVRDSGACNMLDITSVQRYAFDHDMFKLVLFVEEHKKEYAAFIFSGQR